MKIWFYWFIFLGPENLLLVCKGELRYINIQYLNFSDFSTFLKLLTEATLPSVP